MDIAPFKNLIREKAGICFDKSGSELLSGEIVNMMNSMGLKSPRACYDLLVQNQEEFFRFLNLLTVNETYFFREPVHLRLFSEKLIPELLANRSKTEKIRILSAGCSTGEEPYSLSIILHQKYGSDARKLFTITGADIDTQALQKARDGIYTARAFRTEDTALKTCFTDLGNNRFRIKQNISSSVTFHLLNLLNFPYPEPLRDNDIIFYRNVSIYFDPDARKKIFHNLARILNTGGYLIVSATETLSHDCKILSLIEKDGIFLFHKPTGRVEQKDTSSFSAVSEARTSGSSRIASEIRQSGSARSSDATASEARPSGSARTSAISTQNQDIENLYRKALSLACTKAYAPALELLEKAISAYPSFIRAKTLQAGILFNNGHPDEAARICAEVIAEDPLCLEACLLPGLIAKSQGQTEQALRHFRQAIYICSSAWLAHFHTAEICRNRGDSEKAVREYEIVIRLISTGGFSEHGLSFFPFSFSEENILHLCRHNAEKIRNSHRQGPVKEKKHGI